MPHEVFTCNACGETFEKRWTEEEALAEQIANGWGDMPTRDLAVVCDDCYEKLTAVRSPIEWNDKRRKDAE